MTICGIPKVQRVFAVPHRLAWMTWRGVALHLRNDSAVRQMDGALPNFDQRHTCLSFRFAVGATHRLREVTLWRPDSPIYARLVNPGLLREPVVRGLAA